MPEISTLGQRIRRWSGLPLVVAAITLAVTPATAANSNRNRARISLRDWRVKGTVQRILGQLPAGGYIHGVLQRRVGGLSDFDQECDAKIEDWRLMVRQLRDARVDLTSAHMLEIGTGWYPTFPYCLYLAGVPRIVTVDLHRHQDPALTRRLVDRLEVHLPSIADAAGADLREVRRRYRDLLIQRSVVDDAIEYRAPADATAIDLADESLDVVFSNSVLEHVPRDAIRNMYREARRVLRPGGVMFHSVNCGDHYAYSDRSIDQLHYLQYSDAEWERWNNRFLYQNRLRAVDFTTMAREAGFAIVHDTSRAHPMRLAQLERIRVHPQFAHYTPEQLAITSIDFIARKSGPLA